MDLDVMSDAGVNWVSINDMSDAGINWSDIDIFLKTHVRTN